MKNSRSRGNVVKKSRKSKGVRKRKRAKKEGLGEERKNMNIILEAVGEEEKGGRKGEEKRGRNGRVGVEDF